MAIEVLSSGASSASSPAGTEQFSFVVDYDTVAQAIGLTCTGTGHASLDVVRTSNRVSLGALNCDQYGMTQGQVTNGASDGPVTYDGTRKVVLGPGATGVDSTGAPAGTGAIPAAVVGTFNVPKGQTPGLGITLGWRPNSFGLGAVSAEEHVARMAAESDAQLAEIDREMDAMTDELRSEKARRQASLVASAEHCVHRKRHG